MFLEDDGDEEVRVFRDDKEKEERERREFVRSLFWSPETNLHDIYEDPLPDEETLDEYHYWCRRFGVEIPEPIKLLGWPPYPYHQLNEGEEDDEEQEEEEEGGDVVELMWERQNGSDVLVLE